MPSTPSEALVDVNVLVAAVFADHPMHVSARQFLERVDRFFTTPTTEGGFLRFATRPWRNERKQEQPPRLSANLGMTWTALVESARFSVRRESPSSSTLSRFLFLFTCILLGCNEMQAATISRLWLQPDS